MVRASSILKIKDGRYQVSFIIFVSVRKPQFIYVFTTKITHRLRFEISLATIMDKSLGTLLHFWGVLQFTYAKPIPSPKNIVGRVQLCIGWGGRELQEKFEKDALFYEGTQELQENMNTTLLSQRLFSVIVGADHISL